MMQVQSEEMSDTVASVREWVAAWGAEVAAVDFAAGRRRFDADAVAFGTRADVVAGLDHLAAEQWGHVWGTIADFAFNVDRSVVQLADDASLAVAIVPWTSTGFHEDGQSFERPGRATIVLRPRRPDDDVPGDPAAGPDWFAIHTHFSLAIGTPSRSFGRAADGNS